MMVKKRKDEMRCQNAKLLLLLRTDIPNQSCCCSVLERKLKINQPVNSLTGWFVGFFLHGRKIVMNHGVCITVV
jgi:hypothetical protein